MAGEEYPGRLSRHVAAHELLGETREQYRQYFLDLANSTDKGRKARFANIRTELSKMIVPKPVEVDASLNESESDKRLESGSPPYDEAFRFFF